MIGLRDALKVISLKARLTFSNMWSGLGWSGQTGSIIRPWQFPRTKINYTQEVGDLRLSSIVMTGVGWAGRNLNSARLQVVKIGPDRKEEEIQDHPLIKLWDQPNEYYDSSTLLDGFAMSWIMGGATYFILRRSGSGDLMSTAGQVREIWWEPHWTIRPRWPQDGSEFISYYEIWRNGTWQRIHKDNVLVWRHSVDMDTRGGTSRTACLMRGFFTDQQAEQFMAQLLRDGLVPPVVISLGDKGTPFTGDANRFKSELKRKMSGDSAAEPLVVTGPARVSKLGFDYSSVGLKEVRQMPEERFCSVMGISPISLYFSQSADIATYNNSRNYLAHDYRSYIVPLHKRIARLLTKELLPEFGDAPGLEVKWDYSQEPLMQPDRELESRVATEQWKADGLTRAEYREAIGYKPGPDGRDDVFYSEVAGGGDPFGLGLPDSIPPDVQNFLKRLPRRKDVEEGAEWWRTNPAIPEAARELIDAKPIKPNGHTE